MCLLVTLRKRRVSEDEIRLKVASRLGFLYHCNSINLLNKIGMEKMKKFSDVAKRSKGNFEGDKMKLDDILEKVIQITGYNVGESRYKDSCLTVQFKIEEDIKNEDGTAHKDWVSHIFFTGSQALIKQLDGVEIDPLDPPHCKIIKQNLDGGRCFYKLTDPD